MKACLASSRGSARIPARAAASAVAAFVLAMIGGGLPAAGLRVTPAMQQACLDPDPKKAVAACSAVLELGDIPDYARREALDSRAMAFIASGDSDRARADAEALSRLAREPTERARAKALLAQALALGEQFEAAVSASSDALKLDPDDTDSLALRGELLDRLGRDSAALSDLSEVVALRRNQANPYLDRGRFYFHRQDYRRAEDDFEHAVANAPNSALTYYWRGMARLRLRAAEAAGADFDAAINLHKRFPAALARRAELYEAAGDRSRAAEYFGSAAAGPADDPDSTEAREWIAAHRPRPNPIEANAQGEAVAKRPADADATVEKVELVGQSEPKLETASSVWLTLPESDFPKSRGN